MRAWQVREFGSVWDSLELLDIPLPAPAKEAALVRVLAAGVNFPDLLVIAGTYQVRPARPFTPGFEVVGEVVAVGADCTQVSVGERVICWTNIGAFQEYIVVPPEHMFRVPRSMPDVEAAAFLIPYQTAFFCLVHRAKLQADEVLLVHGGAGAVGSAAIQLGKALGAQVIATARNSDKEAICRRLHADHTINLSALDFAEEVQNVTAHRGANVILDPVGGEIFERSLKCIAWEGRIVPLGFTGGQIPSLKVNRILLKNISVVGLYWSEYWRHNQALIHAAQVDLNSFYEQGLIRPLIRSSFKMDELPKALTALQEPHNYGKSVIMMT